VFVLQLLLLLLLRLNDALPTAVRVGRRGGHRTTVVERVQLYVLRLAPVVVLVVVVVAAAPVVTVVPVAAAADGPPGDDTAAVDGARRVRR
jgi:hypothetical protein